MIDEHGQARVRVPGVQRVYVCMNEVMIDEHGQARVRVPGVQRAATC